MSKIGEWILNTFFKEHMDMFNHYQTCYHQTSSIYKEVCADREKYMHDLEKKTKENVSLLEELTIYKKWYDPKLTEPSKEAKDALYRDLTLLYLKQAIMNNSLSTHQADTNPYGINLHTNGSFLF